MRDNKLDENLLKRVKLMSASDAERVYEAIEKSSKKITKLLSYVNENILESDLKTVQKEIFKEVRKLEKLTIVEAVSAKSFFEVQQHFRSMVRAANILINWLKGSSGVQRMEALRTQGIELLNDLYEHIKDLESGEETPEDLLSDKATLQKRDQFVKVFADFATLFRGFMNVADIFSDDPVSVGGYSDMKDVFMSLERDDLMSDPLGYALAFYDHHANEVNPKKGFFGKFGAKTAGLTGKFKNAIAKAWSAAPGSGNFMGPDELTEYLMGKSADQLLAIFGRFNDFVANDVDVNWLLNVTKNPRTLGSMLKSVWDAFGGGTLKSFNR